MKHAGDAMVHLLSRCQHAFIAANQTGMLFPYDVRAFQRLYDNGANCQPVCVPFYVLHKMFAGLLDQHTRAGNAEARDMAVALGHVRALSAVWYKLPHGRVTVIQ